MSAIPQERYTAADSTAVERRLRWFLRGTGVVLLLALPAVFMPHPWMNAVGESLGLPDLPNQPLVGYLTRSLSALYALLGTWCWFLAADVRRYLKLLTFCGLTTLAFGLLLLVVDLAVGMPSWWSGVEAGFVLGWSAVLLTMVRRARGSNV